MEKSDEWDIHTLRPESECALGHRQKELACQPHPKRTSYVLSTIKQPHTATHRFPPVTIKLFKKLSF